MGVTGARNPLKIPKITSDVRLKARSDVLHKTHQPGLFLTHVKNAASLKILYLTA